MKETNKEVLEKIEEKLESYSVEELNALVVANYAGWRKSAPTLEEWNPAGNPLHAHDLIDKLLDDGLFVNLYGRKNDWTCEIMDKHAKVYAEMTADSMPKSVCGAALITVLTKYGEMKL